MRSDRERLLDVLEAIEKIGSHAAGGVEALAADEMLQVWVIHHLQIIGEAAHGISSQFKSAHSHIPWEQIIGMRHVLVHGYFLIDLDLVWAATEKDLPYLKAAIEAGLRELDS